MNPKDIIKFEKQGVYSVACNKTYVVIYIVCAKMINGLTVKGALRINSENVQLVHEPKAPMLQYNVGRQLRKHLVF